MPGRFDGQEFHFGANYDSSVPTSSPASHHSPFTTRTPPSVRHRRTKPRSVITDDLGTVLTNANMFVCPLAADGTPCATNGFPDAPTAKAGC